MVYFETRSQIEDLYEGKRWCESEPDVPDRRWYNDFGSFKVCGDSKYPKPFLLHGEPVKGQTL